MSASNVLVLTLPILFGKLIALRDERRLYEKQFYSFFFRRESPSSTLVIHVWSCFEKYQLTKMQISNLAPQRDMSFISNNCIYLIIIECWYDRVEMKNLK